MKIPNYLMQQEIIIELYEGNSAYGKKYSEPKIENGRFTKSNKKVTDYTGAEVVANGQLFLYPYVKISPESRVTVGGNSYEVIEVTPIIAFKNIHHYEVMLK